MSTDNNLLLDYIEFVDEVSSDATKHTDDFIDSIEVVEENGVDPSRLLTASIGLSGETGEFNDIVKKCIFQGKPLNDETVFHLKRELGDIMWYWINSCRALGLDPNEVVEENVNKLKSRYPGGEFDVFYSENRKEGDL